MKPKDPLGSLERGRTPLARWWCGPALRRGGVHYFPAADPVAMPFEDLLPMLAVFSLATAAWCVVLPSVGMALVLAFLSGHVWFMLCGLLPQGISSSAVFHAGWLVCGLAAWRQPGWPRGVVMGVGIFLLLQGVAALWLRLRQSVAGVTVLIFLLHVWPFVCGWIWGWSWAVGGCLITGTILVATTLNPHSHWFGMARRTLPMGEREVCLTIDDGPCEDTAAVLALLERHDARAVFFLIGDRVRKFPEAVEAILAGGHLLGNHTQTHPAHTFWSYPPARQRREMAACQEALGGRAKWFRAPAGFRNPYCNLIAGGLGLRVMGWQARGRDGVSSDVVRVVERIRRKLGPGSIVLVHQGLPHSLEVMENVLKMLRDEGWTIRLPEALTDPDPLSETPPASCEKASDPTVV